MFRLVLILTTVHHKTECINLLKHIYVEVWMFNTSLLYQSNTSVGCEPRRGMTSWFATSLPDSTATTNKITALASASRPHLCQRANRRGRLGLPSRRGPSHTGNSGKKLQGSLWSWCEGDTDFLPSLPVKPVSLDSTRSSTATGTVSDRKLFRGSSENNLPPFFVLSLSPFTFNWVSSYHLERKKKGEPSCYFYFNLCSNCSFYPCGPWWLRTVILWWCSLGQQLVQMGINWVRMRGK